MFQFFEVIIGFFQNIVNYILNLFELLGYVISFVVQGFGYAIACINYLPTWVLPFILASIGLSVVLFIINR